MVYTEAELDLMKKKDVVKLFLEQQAVHQELEKLNDRIKTLETKFDEMHATSKVSQNTSTLLLGKVKSLESQLLKAEQYSRRECIDISGIPEAVEDHEVEQHVCNLFKDIGVEVNAKNDIQACHRYGRKAVVIVKFSNRKTVRKILDNKSKLPEKIFANETLCPRNKVIRGRCGVLKKEGKISNVATRNGMVRIKLLNSNQYVDIDHEDDLTELP